MKVVTFYMVKLLNKMSHKISTKKISLLSIKHVDIGLLGFDPIIEMIIILEKMKVMLISVAFFSMIC